MSFKKSAISLLALLVFALATVPLMAQSTTTGDINGTVTDSTGAIVPKATVTVKNDTGVNLTTTTNATGYYHFSFLKPGTYTVTAEAPGMQATSRGVAVLIGQVADAPIQVGVKGETTTVEVTAEAPLLQTENANIATSYSQKQLDLIPNGGNDITHYAQTAPGVLINSSSGGGYGNFTAFGLPATANLFTVNGNDEMDPYLNLNNSGATNLLLGTNELQEVAVVSNGYTGQYGRQAGAQIDYATKSGTNNWHGNLNYWYTGSSLSANDWFLAHSNTPLGKEVNNQYSASIGGPIKKDKLFFFVDTEGLRYTLASSNLTFVPTPAFEAAVINSLNGSSGAPKSVPFYQNMFSLYNGAKIQGSLLSAASQGASNFGCGDINADDGTGTGTPSAGFLIPELAAFGDKKAVVNTAGVPMAGLGGQPCTAAFFSNASNSSIEWTLAGRVDWNASDKDKVAIRYKNDIGDQPTYTDPISPVFNAFSHQPQYEGQITENHVFSPTLVNQMIVSGSWYSAFFSAEPGAAAAFPYGMESFDIPLGGGAGFFALGGENFAFPQGRNVTQYQLTDDVSWIRGSHTLKFGTNYRRNDITDGIFGVRSVFPRARIFSGSDWATGFIDQLSARFPKALEQPIAIYSLGAYAQDEWRVTSNLKFTMALRVDHNSNAVCQHDCVALTTAPFGSLTKDPTQPYNSFLVDGHHQVFPDVEKAVVQPRFGFTYSPLGHKSTVVRGGIGLFSDLYPGTLADTFAGNPPERLTFSLPGMLSPAETGSAQGIVNGCATAFRTNYAAGGNNAGFLALAPAGCRQPDVATVVDTVKNPKYVEYNLEVQQSFGQKTAVSVNYVGNHGYDIFNFSPSVNASCAVGTAAKPGPCFKTNGFGGLPVARPDLSFRNMTDVSNLGWSNYNGLTFSATRKFSYGFQGKFNYTWSHAQDTVSNGGVDPYSLNDSELGQINPFNLKKLNYGNADYDVRHNITADYLWELPYKSSNRWMDYVIGGWSVSGTVMWHTGYPFTVNDGGLLSHLSNNVNASTMATFLGGVPFDSCNNSPSAKTSSTSCLAGTNFVTSGKEGDFGNTERNSFRGPGYFNTDFTLNKNFKLTERVNLRLGANVYNALNHASFNNPVHDISSGTFGQYFTAASPPTSPYGAFVGSAATARILQVSGKITF